MAATVVDITRRLAHTAQQRELFNQTIAELNELTGGTFVSFFCSKLDVRRVDEISMARIARDLRGLRRVLSMFRRIKHRRYQAD